MCKTMQVIVDRERDEAEVSRSKKIAWNMWKNGSMILIKLQRPHCCPLSRYERLLHKNKKISFVSIMYQSVKNIILDNEVFTLDDGERKDCVILSGIHDYYETEGLNLLMVDDRIPAGAKLY